MVCTSLGSLLRLLPLYFLCSILLIHRVGFELKCKNSKDQVQMPS